MQKIRIFVNILVLILCVVLYTSRHWGNFVLGPDQLVQYSTAKNLANGHGLTMLLPNYTDISVPNYNVHSEFAPGVAICTAPFFLIFSDYRIVNTIFVIGVDFVFVLLTLLLLKHLLSRNLNFNEVTLVIAFYVIVFGLLMSESISDMICLDCFILSVLLMSKFLNDNKLHNLILCCFFVCVTSYFRYAYLAALFVIPCFFLFRIIFLKTKEYKSFVIALISILVFSTIFIGHIYSINISTGYVSGQSSAKGFYPENIAMVNPFPLNCFIDHNIILKFLGYGSENIDRGYVYPYWIHLCFLFGSIVILFPAIYLQNYISKQKNTVRNGTIQFSCIYMLGLLGLVFLASVINPSQEEDYVWSWAQVGRYYMVPSFCITFCYLAIVMEHVKLSKPVVYFCMIVMLGAGLFNMALITRNYVVNYKLYDKTHNMGIMRPNNSLVNSNDLYNYFFDIEGYKTVVVDGSVSSDLYKISSFLDLADAVSINSSEFMQHQSEIRTSQKHDIYIVTGNVASDDVKQLLYANNATVVRNMNNNILIYKYIIEPND